MVESDARKGEFGEISSGEKRLNDEEEARLRKRLSELGSQKMELAGGNGGLAGWISRNSLLCTVALALVILAATIYVRVPLLQYQGFFEPDGFYHYSVMMQAAANGFQIPLYSVYSSFPTHTMVTEPSGLYYVTLIPYYLFRGAGLTIYSIERNIAIVFGLLDVIASYFLVRYLARSRALGLLSMAAVALSGGDAARTSALVYRGDGFITIFLILALIFMIKAIGNRSRRRYAYMVLVGILLGIGTLVWNGAPFVLIVYLFAILLLAAYGFIKGNRKLLWDTVLLSAVLLITYGMQHIFIYLGLLRGGQALSSIHFFIFYAPILLGSLLFYYLLGRKDRPLMSRRGRAMLLLVVALLILAVVLSLFYSYIAEIATGAGLVIAGSPLTTTIQELQKPTFGFLWVSFDVQLFLAPIGIAAFVLLYRRRGLSAVLSDTAVEAFLIILAYFVVTFYLQINAVRFNSLVSVPIAIFAAYAIYSAGKFLQGRKLFGMDVIYPYLIIAIALLVIMSYVALLQSTSEIQADNLNPLFLNAVEWLRNNTAANATVLTLWPDGSVVEGFGQRQSFTDSVGGQNEQNIANFSVFLFNTTNSAAYIEKVHPDYILARGYWFQEFGGIALEGSIPNASQFGINMMQPANPVKNGNSTMYGFASPDFRAVMVINVTGNVRSVAAYISYRNGNFVPLNRILFYNFVNGSYSFVNVTSTGANYTLFVPYAASNGTISVGNGAILGPKMPNSNLFKFVILCGQYQCPYNNQNVTLTQVYGNTDTKIFRVNYLK